MLLCSQPDFDSGSPWLRWAERSVCNCCKMAPLSIWVSSTGCGSKPMGSHFGGFSVNSPPMSEPILVLGLNRMFTGGTIGMLDFDLSWVPRGHVSLNRRHPNDGLDVFSLPSPVLQLAMATIAMGFQFDQEKRLAALLVSLGFLRPKPGSSN